MKSSGLFDCTSTGLATCDIQKPFCFRFSNPLTATLGDAEKLFSNCTHPENLCIVRCSNCVQMSLTSTNDHENLMRALGPVSNVLKTLDILVDLGGDFNHRFFAPRPENLQFTQLRILCFHCAGYGSDFAMVLDRIDCRLEFLNSDFLDGNKKTEDYIDLNSVCRATSKCKRF